MRRVRPVLFRTASTTPMSSCCPRVRLITKRTHCSASRQALVTDIVPDSKVRAAMNDINASQRLRWGHRWVIC